MISSIYVGMILVGILIAVCILRSKYKYVISLVFPATQGAGTNNQLVRSGSRWSQALIRHLKPV